MAPRKYRVPLGPIRTNGTTMKDDTILTHAGCDPFANHGIVNPPVYHASTVLFRTMDELVNRQRNARVSYGRRGTPTTFALEEAVTALEGGHGTVLAPSGLAAVTMALTAFARSGDHILVTDSTYAPTRRFCDTVLARLGIEVEYYDPLIADGIEKLMRPNTRLVWLESPGSQTFEIQDVPAIADAAHRRGVRVLIDNTWGAGYYLKPLSLGADVVVQAATKYIVGHSDVLIGTITCSAETYDEVKEAVQTFGVCAGPDDVYLALRGLRTMAVRLTRHYENGLRIAEWLATRPEVLRVMHPALPDDPGHVLWQRDFTGASGLFGFVLNTTDQTRIAAMLDGMKLFGMGFSWGGFESLIVPTWPERYRTATEWKPGGQTLRLHVGLEDPDDLISDLEQAFDRLNNGS